MLRDIDRRAAVFAAQRKALQDAQADDDDRRDDADACRAGDHANASGGYAHQRHGHKKRVFAPQPVSEEAEQDCAERPEAEADGKASPHEQDFKRLVIAGKEGGSDERSKRAVDEKVVPLEDRPRRTRRDHEANFLVGRFPLQGSRAPGHALLPNCPLALFARV